MKLTQSVVLLALITLSLNLASPAAPLHLADYDSELRRPDGHVDNDAMIRRLNDLGVNSYYWLVWHSASDWDDLKQFLPKAAAAHISVWVYLVPPTEDSPEHSSQPFGRDYGRWAEEIARLSLEHTNLAGWIMDDFYANRTFFTPAYMEAITARAKAINPHLQFRPIMYFPEITDQAIAEYAKCFDGIIACYPPSRQEVISIHSLLNGPIEPGRVSLSCPWGTKSQPGDFVQIETSARIKPKTALQLRFDAQDDFNGTTAGYHFKQLLVNGSVVWQEDVAGGQRRWQHVAVDLPAVSSTTNISISFRLFDKEGVSNFGVRWWIKDLSLAGGKLSSDLAHVKHWKATSRGPLSVDFPAPTQARSQVHLPCVLLTAAEPAEFKMRHGEPDSPERIAAWLKMCLQCCRDGYAEGVVTYCLDKSAQSPVFPPVQEVFHEFKNP